MTTAAITCVTGINGAGKTLYLLPMVEKLRKETGRPVFYFAIPCIAEAGVLDEWEEIQPFDRDDPESRSLKDPGCIHRLPKGAIIVVDEAHRSFGRTNGKEPPQYITDFDMCRHRGHTIFLCTQDPQDLHHFVRRRIGKHYHCVRVWGLERSTVLEWETVGDPKSSASTKLAQKHEFSFPKDVYRWYKSSDQHTIQKRPPLLMLAAIPGGIVLAGVLLWWAFQRTGATFEAEEKPAQEAPQEAPQGTRVAAALDPLQEGPEWAYRQRERVQGQPMSAQFYDAAWKAITLPKISGCSHIKINEVERCTCNSQQGTTLATVSHSACMFYVKNGWFDPTKRDDDEREGDRRTATATSTASAAPAVDTAAALMP